MAGIAKDYKATEIMQGPGDLWVIGGAPTDAAVRLTLASDGTPDATAHPASIHLGAIQSAVTTQIKPKTQAIELDQYDAPFDSYVTDLDAKIEAELAQSESQKLQRMMGVAAYGTGAGYKQFTFGGNLVVPKACIAAISPTRQNQARHVVSLLYSAAAVGGIQISMGRAKSSSYKASFQGLADITRTAGKQVGVIYQTLADAAAGTPTAKDFSLAEIYQGPADLWLISPAPTDASPRIALDAATLTPDAASHGQSKHLGMTNGAIGFTLTPKIDMLRGDQFDAPVDVSIATIEAKLEAEMVQTSMEKLSRALGVGTFSTSANAYDQITFGGTNQPATYCIAAIGRKRLDETKAVVCCLYSVNTVDGITVTMSRKKTSTYKLTFSGQLDPTRTAGKQMGIFHEMV
jgi:hypothetical protein